MENCSRRNYEHILNKIQLAHLDSNELTEVAQSLFVSKNIVYDTFYLLELNSSLEKHLYNGDTLFIRGDLHDNVCLCTENETFELKEAETSDCLLLLENLYITSDTLSDEKKLFEQQVCGIFSSVLESKKIIPRCQKLKKILDQTAYNGPLEECNISGRKYSIYDLKEIIQASNQELLNVLKIFDAFELEGYWRVLSFDYKFRLLSLILNIINENSWNFNSVSKEITLRTLSELEPEHILSHCFDIFLSSTNEINNRGLETSLSQLEGLALIDYSAMPKTISYFSVYSLPDSVAERFEYLFKNRDKWTFEEIRPFLEYA